MRKFLSVLVEIVIILHSLFNILAGEGKIVDFLLIVFPVIWIILEQYRQKKSREQS